MRKSLFLSAIAAAALAAPAVEAQEARAPENTSLDREGLPTLEAGEMRLADRIAADFFENGLRLSQSRRIEAETAVYYVSLSPEEREEFREERRRFLRALSHEQRLALRNVKRPAYNNLSENQKERFRQQAVSALAPSQGAGSGADDQEI